MAGLIPKKIFNGVLAPFLFIAFGLYPLLIANAAYATNLLTGTWSNTSYSGQGNAACSNGQPNYGTWEQNTLTFSYIPTTVTQSVTIAEPSQVLFIYNAYNRADNSGASITVNLSDFDQTITSGNYVPPTNSTQYGMEVTTTAPNEVVTISINGRDNRGWAGCYGSMLTNLSLTATPSAPVVVVPPAPPAPPANSISLTVNENDTLSFNLDGATVTSVFFASYGTPENYSIGQCHSDSSLSVITEAFVGRSNGSISADNGVFGDPCGGTYKRLSVILVYEPTAPSTSPEPTPSASPSPTPETSTAPSPSPSPTVEPEPSPSPSATPTPEPSPEPSPVPNPSPTPDPAIEAARLEAERLAAIAAENARLAEEKARLAEEEARKAEEEARLKAEEDARLEAERIAQEEADRKAEEERLAAEKEAAEKEAERLAAEEEAKKAEEERLVAEAEAKAKAEADAALEEQRAKDEAERIAQEEENAKAEAEALDKALEDGKITEADTEAVIDSLSADGEISQKEVNNLSETLAADGKFTEAEKQLVAEVLIQAADGQAVSAEAIKEAGLDYSDLPDTQPVDVRTDENGNEVIITAVVADALELLASPAEMLSAIFESPAQLIFALGNLGADMSEAEREEATKTVVAATLVGNIAATTVAASAVGAVGYRRNI